MSASLAPECNEVKERYDTCFLKWYSEKYLRGTGTDNNECADLFKNYQKCLTVALKERGIDKMLDEAREDSKENDATYLGRKCELAKLLECSQGTDRWRRMYISHLAIRISFTVFGALKVAFVRGNVWQCRSCNLKICAILSMTRPAAIVLVMLA